MIASFRNLASANAASSSHDLIELKCKADWTDQYVLSFYFLLFFSQRCWFDVMDGGVAYMRYFWCSFFLLLSPPTAPSSLLSSPLPFYLHFRPEFKLKLVLTITFSLASLPPSSLPHSLFRPQTSDNYRPRHRTRRRPDMAQDLEYERRHWRAAQCTFLFFGHILGLFICFNIQFPLYSFTSA